MSHDKELTLEQIQSQSAAFDTQIEECKRRIAEYTNKEEFEKADAEFKRLSKIERDKTDLDNQRQLAEERQQLAELHEQQRLRRNDFLKKKDAELEAFEESAAERRDALKDEQDRQTAQSLQEIDEELNSKQFTPSPELEALRKTKEQFIRANRFLEAQRAHIALEEMLKSEEKRFETDKLKQREKKKKELEDRQQKKKREVELDISRQSRELSDRLGKEEAQLESDLCQQMKQFHADMKARLSSVPSSPQKSRVLAATYRPALLSDEHTSFSSSSSQGKGRDGRRGGREGGRGGMSRVNTPRRDTPASTPRRSPR